MADDQQNLNKGIAYKADEDKCKDPLQEIRDNLAQMTKKLFEALKRVEKGINRDSGDVQASVARIGVIQKSLRTDFRRLMV